MNVLVESNFILELVLEQEQVRACQDLLQLARDGVVRIVVPAYCMLEPYETLHRRHRERMRLHRELGGELRQLGRTASAATLQQASADVLSLLVDSANVETTRIAQTRSDLLNVAEVVPLSSEIIRDSGSYQARHDLSPQDATVYASVVDHLRRNLGVESVFVSRDSTAFDDPDIRFELNELGCKFFSNFGTTLQFLTRPRR